MSITPSIVQKGFNQTSTWDLETELFNTKREIFIDKEIDENLAISIIKQIKCLSSESNDPINLIISSPGGDVDYGFAIIDEIEKCKFDVNALAVGRVASMAALIFAACKKRMMNKHSRILIHNPYLSSGAKGTLENVKQQAEHLNSIQDLQAEILAKACNQPKEKIMEICDKDQFMSATEAYEIGLCNHIIGGNKNA